MNDGVTIFENCVAGLKVNYDEDGPLVIGILTDLPVAGIPRWIEKDVAAKFAQSILTALGAEGPRASEISFNEALLRLAAVHERVVSFSYGKTPTAPVERRRIAPAEVKQYADGHVTCVGFDQDREEIRAFRVDRMGGDVTIEA